jgi:hypothetical protein
MTLKNLLKTGQLKPHQADAKEVRRLLDAARRNLRDSVATNISPENRFDAAYKAVMQSALVALMANGFVPDTKSPGHHAVVIQSLPKAIGIAADRVAVLDTLRRKRNLSDYTGEDIDERSVAECRAEAKRLLDDVSAWLKEIHPELAA